MAPIPPGPTRPREWRLIRVCLPGAWMIRSTLVLSELGGKYKFGRVDPNRRAGSSDNLQFVFDSGYVSREHCSIYCRGGVWHIRDHKSSNGTFLNGVKILEERELRENDRIGLGIDSLTSPNLQPPMEAYHIFTFQQGGLDAADVEVLPQPAKVIPKLEEPEVIILDDSDGEEPERSLCSTTITPGPVEEPEEEQVENECTKKEKTVNRKAEAAALQKRKDEDELKRNNDEDKKRLAEKAERVAELKRQEEEKQRMAEAAEKKRLAEQEVEKKRLAKLAVEKLKIVLKREEALKLLSIEKEARKAEEVEKQRLEKGQEEARKREEAEMEQKAKDKEAERRRQEIETKKQLKAEAEEARKKKEEAELKRLAKEEAELKRLAKEEAELKRLAKEEAELKRLAKEEADRMENKRLAKEVADRIEKKRLAKEEADRVEKQRLVKEEADSAENRRLEEELERRRQRELVNAEKRRKSEVARRAAEDRRAKELAILKREEKRRQKDEARIAREQLAELQNSDSTSSSSSSDDMEVDFPQPLVDQEILVMTRKNQAMMTEKVNRSADKKKKTVTASPQRPYKRIRVLTTSSSETEEDLGFLSQGPNPYVASLPSAAPGARPNQSFSALAQKVANQFRRSCTENGVDTAPAPKKRKTPDDVQGRVDSVPKKQREEARPLANPPPTPPSRPADIDVRPVYITDKTASLPQPPITPQRQQPPVTPVVASISTRPPVGTTGETHRSQPNIASSMPPPPLPKQNQTPMLVTTGQTRPQQQTFIQASPVVPKPQRQPKDLNTAIGNVYNRVGKQGSKIKLLPGAVPLPHRQRQQQRHEASRRTSMDDETSPPGPSGPGRKEKLRELTSKNKTSSMPQRRAAYPPPASVKTKTTNMSRSDRLLDAISAPPVVPSTSSEKPKAAVAPMQPRAESGDPNVVNAIKRKMDNNRLSQVAEKPKVANRLPHVENERPSSGTNGHQGRGGGPFPSTSTNSLPQPSRGGHGGLISGSTTVSSATLSYGAKMPISGNPIPTATATSSSTTPNITVERLPEDQVYQDALMWNTQWLQEQESNMKPPPPVNHGQPVLTNLPIYKDYESYKNTFYPLMLLELWAAIFQDSTSNDNFRQKSRLGMDSVELAVGIESFAASNSCPLLINPQQNTHRRQKSQNGATQPEGVKFYHSFRLSALVERHGELNRERDFGTITFDFRRSNGEVQPLTFFAFFQEPQYEEITNMTVIPKSLEKERRSKKFKVTFQMVTHLKYDVTRLIRDNGGKMKKICYISSKIRDFRSLSQLPDSSLFQHILSPPNCTPEQVMSNNGVSRSELVADAFEKLNPIQRSVVHHISRRVGKGSGPDLMLLHGPPGTGKTRTIVGLIMQLTMDYRCNNPGKQMKILVCTPSNTAVDEIIRRIMQDEDGLKIVRIGSGSTAEDTKKYLLEEVAKPFMSKAGQIDSINQAIRNVDRKIMNAKSEIDDLKADDEKKNGTVISSFEANIIEWQRDRKMYICDLNSVGQMAQLIFENVTLNYQPTSSDDLTAFIEPWILLKQALGLNALDLPTGGSYDVLPAQDGCEDNSSQSSFASNSAPVNAVRKSARFDVMITLHQTCRFVLERLEFQHITLMLVKRLMKEYSSLDDPCETLAYLIRNAKLHRYSSQSVDNISSRQLPEPFLQYLQPVETGSDGNCFYRAVSHSIFGSEKFFELLRIRILLDVLENDGSYTMFTTLAQTEDDCDGLVISVGTLGAYAGDAAIYAASRVLRRPIHVYAEFPNAPYNASDFFQYMSNPGNRQHRRTLFDDAYEFEEPVCIHYRASGNGGTKDHFVALLQRNDTATVFPCNVDEFIRLRRFGS